MTEPKNHNSNHKTSTGWLVLLPLLIMVIIFALSSRSELPDLDGGRGLQNIAGHFLIYAALGATLSLFACSLGWKKSRVLLFAIVIATLYGVTDEFHQSFVPHRSVEIKDVIVDFLGAAAGTLAILRWPRSPHPINVKSDAVPNPPADENS